MDLLRNGIGNLNAVSLNIHNNNINNNEIWIKVKTTFYRKPHILKLQNTFCLSDFYRLFQKFHQCDLKLDWDANEPNFQLYVSRFFSGKDVHILGIEAGWPVRRNGNSRHKPASHFTAVLLVAFWVGFQVWASVRHVYSVILSSECLLSQDMRPCEGTDPLFVLDTFCSPSLHGWLWDYVSAGDIISSRHGDPLALEAVFGNKACEDKIMIVIYWGNRYNNRCVCVC